MMWKGLFKTPKQDPHDAVGDYKAEERDFLELTFFLDQRLVCY